MPTKTCRECGKPFKAPTFQLGERELDLVAYCDPCIERLDAEERALKERDAYERNLAASNLPLTLREATFAGVSHTAALEGAKLWARHGGGICLTGPVGVGKSWLAAAAVKARCRKAPTRWVQAATLLTQLRGGWAEGSAEARQLVAGRGAIVLDDLDKANATDFAREVMFATIDNRVQAGAPLVVTTNLPLSRLGERLGDAVMSRLAGYCRVYVMEGEDRRIG